MNRCRPVILGLALVACGQLPADAHPPVQEAAPPTAAPPVAPPPAAETPEGHPGAIVFADLDLGTENARPVADLPETMAWVLVDGAKVPVVRVEARSMSENAREIKKYGPAGQLLESTIQVRRVQE
jgi:hypothetical protein